MNSRANMEDLSFAAATRAWDRPLKSRWNRWSRTGPPSETEHKKAGEPEVNGRTIATPLNNGAGWITIVYVSVPFILNTNSADENVSDEKTSDNNLIYILLNILRNITRNNYISR